jgi:hypothetical protein
MKFLNRLFGLSRENKNIQTVADGAISVASVIHGESLKDLTRLIDLAQVISKTHTNNSADGNQPTPVVRSYSLFDLFYTGKTALEFGDSPRDFVKVDYEFSTGCTNTNADTLSFDFKYANWDLSPFVPNSVTPKRSLETHRRGDYCRKERANASLFIRKELLETASGSLEKAVNQIPQNATLKYRNENGHIRCCYGNVFIRVSSADGKTFDYILKKQIAETKPTEENLSCLRSLYNESGKNDIVAYLDKKLAVAKKTIDGKQSPPKRYSLEHLSEQDELSFAHPRLRQTLADLDSQVAQLVSARDGELAELTTLYDGKLTEETLTGKRNALIANYDPKIAELSEKKYDLQRPQREVIRAIANLGDKDIRTMPREDYEKVERAYRITKKHPLDKRQEG